LITSVQHINLASVAAVCETDIISVELILREIVAQLKCHLQQGSNIRLMFKVGSLYSRGGELKWKSFNEEGRPFAADNMSQVSRFSSNGKASIYSMQKKDFSVRTPSVAKTRSMTIGSKSTTTALHPSNPNPQGEKKIKFKGVRDLGYSVYEQVMDPTDIVKFGKKVNYESKQTNMQVMDDHLRQIRQKF